MIIGGPDPRGEPSALQGHPGGQRRGPLRAVRQGPLAGDSFGGWALVSATTAFAIATFVGFAVWVFYISNGYQLALGQLVAVFTVLLLVPWMVEAIHAPPDLPARFDPDRAEAHRGFAQADRWERRLTASREDVERFSRVVRDRVVVVVAERLRQRHGVRLDRQPEQARAILGNQLYLFLTAPLPRTPTPDEMDWFITRIERI